MVSPIVKARMLTGKRRTPPVTKRYIARAAATAASRAIYQSAARRGGFYLSGRRRLNARTGGYLGIERKFYDTTLAGTALAAPTGATGGEVDPATVLCLSAPAQGDGESNRDGRKITITQCHVAGVITCNSQATQSAADDATTCMVALVLDTQSNGAQLNSEDVFTNPGASALLASDVFRNLQYSSRFKVLGVKKITLMNPSIANNAAASGNLTQSGLQKRWRFDLQKLNIPVTFTGTTAGIANVTDNSLHIVAFCTSTGLAPNITYNSRIRFVG